jgi:hypothetical protein
MLLQIIIISSSCNSPWNPSSSARIKSSCIMHQAQSQPQAWWRIHGTGIPGIVHQGPRFGIFPQGPRFAHHPHCQAHCHTTCSRLSSKLGFIAPLLSGLQFLLEQAILLLFTEILQQWHKHK